MIKITGHPIRHKNRIIEMQNRFIESGETVEVTYKNMNHILITYENQKGKDSKDKTKS